MKINEFWKSFAFMYNFVLYCKRKAFVIYFMVTFKYLLMEWLIVLWLYKSVIFFSQISNQKAFYDLIGVSLWAIEKICWPRFCWGKLRDKKMYSNAIPSVLQEIRKKVVGTATAAFKSLYFLDGRIHCDLLCFN